MYHLSGHQHLAAGPMSASITDVEGPDGASKDRRSQVEALLKRISEGWGARDVYPSWLMDSGSLAELFDGLQLLKTEFPDSGEGATVRVGLDNLSRLVLDLDHPQTKELLADPTVVPRLSELLKRLVRLCSPVAAAEACRELRPAFGPRGEPLSVGAFVNALDRATAAMHFERLLAVESRNAGALRTSLSHWHLSPHGPRVLVVPSPVRSSSSALAASSLPKSDEGSGKA